MACSLCGEAGHNRRTHQDHPVPQTESLIAWADRAYVATDRPGPQTESNQDTPQFADRFYREPLVELGPEVVAGALSEVLGPMMATVARIEDQAAADAVVGAGEPVTPQISSSDFDDVQVEEDPGFSYQSRSELSETVWQYWHLEDEPAVAVGAVYTPWRTVLGPDEPIRITLPGVYHLTAGEYHDTTITGDWFSNSDAKKLLESCPEQFDYDRRHGVRKTSDAFDFGHVAHNLVLGRGEAYRVFEPCKLDGRTKDGKAQKLAVDQARAEGLTPIYGDQFAVITAMADRLKADPVANDLLTQPGRSEVCLFWEEELRVTDPANSLFGQLVTVKRRAMLDRLPDMPDDPGEVVRVVDYKTADEVKPDDRLRKKVHDYGYHRQAATYEAAVQVLFGRVAEVVFVLQSKTPPHLVVPVEMDSPARLVAAAENREAMQVWAECVATGVWPGYTKGIALSGVPAWIERQYEDEMVIR